MDICARHRQLDRSSSREQTLRYRCTVHRIWNICRNVCGPTLYTCMLYEFSLSGLSDWSISWVTRTVWPIFLPTDSWNLAVREVMAQTFADGLKELRKRILTKFISSFFKDTKTWARLRTTASASRSMDHQLSKQMFHRTNGPAYIPLPLQKTSQAATHWYFPRKNILVFKTQISQKMNEWDMEEERVIHVSY